MLWLMSGLLTGGEGYRHGKGEDVTRAVMLAWGLLVNTRTHTGHELGGGPRRDTPIAVLSVPNTMSSEANKAEARTGTWEVQDESGT